MSTQRRTTYSDVLEGAAMMFMIGALSIEIEGKDFPVTYDDGYGRVDIKTTRGNITLFQQPPSKDSLAGQFARTGVDIIRVMRDGKLLDFGLLYGEYVENVERECTRIVLS